MRIIIYLISIFVLVSCKKNDWSCKDSCCGETFEDSYTKIEGVKATVGSITNINSGDYSYLEFSDSISSNHRTGAIQLSISSISYVSTHKIQNSNFSFISTAYACSPPEPIANQKISSIKIISDSDIIAQNSTYKAGEPLNDLFEIRSGYFLSKFSTFESYIQAQNNDTYLFGPQNSHVIFLLNQNINFPKSEITLKITLDDGKELLSYVNNFEIIKD